MLEAGHHDLPRVSPYYLGILAHPRPGFGSQPYPKGTPEADAWVAGHNDEYWLRTAGLIQRPPLGKIV